VVDDDAAACEADHEDEGGDEPAVSPAVAAPTQAQSTGRGAAVANASVGGQAQLTPAAQARMLEIAKHLKVAEILKAQVVVNQIVGPERDALFVKLMALPAAEAAQVIRAELARRAGR